MLHLAQPIPADDALLLTFADLDTRPRYTGDEKRRLSRKRLSDRLTAPHLTAQLDEEHDAASEPLLSVVEVFLPPDDSYDALDLDPDLYGYGSPANEAETMTAPFDWDAMTEAAA